MARPFFRGGGARPSRRSPGALLRAGSALRNPRGGALARVPGGGAGRAEGDPQRSREAAPPPQPPLPQRRPLGVRSGRHCPILPRNAGPGVRSPACSRSVLRGGRCTPGHAVLALLARFFHRRGCSPVIQPDFYGVSFFFFFSLQAKITREPHLKASIIFCCITLRAEDLGLWRPS